jgi:hypothetical protein
LIPPATSTSASKDPSSFCFVMATVHVQYTGRPSVRRPSHFPVRCVGRDSSAEATPDDSETRMEISPASHSTGRLTAGPRLSDRRGLAVPGQTTMLRRWARRGSMESAQPFPDHASCTNLRAARQEPSRQWRSHLVRPCGPGERD